MAVGKNDIALIFYIYLAMACSEVAFLQIAGAHNISNMF